MRQPRKACFGGVTFMATKYALANTNAYRKNPQLQDEKKQPLTGPLGFAGKKNF